MFDLANFDITQFQASASEAAKLLRALGNERRLMILCQLTERERSVGELLPLVGLSQSALSQHLGVLREEGVVATRREAQTIWYRISDPAALKLVATLAEIFCPPTVEKTDARNIDAPQT
jgi:DNA-binding transcriptional ArsR family regulator